MPRGLVRGWTKHLTPPVPGWSRTDPLDRGLVGEWRFDPATGLTVPDYSGRGNHGDNVGADWITREVGPALQFVTANNDYVDTGVERIGGTGLFAAATEQFTIEVGARIDNNKTGYLVARKSAAPLLGTFGIFFNRPIDAAYSPGVYMRGWLIANATNWGLDDGIWHWYWVTWDGAVGRIYADATYSMALAIDVGAEEVGQRIIFGARTNGAGFWLDGDICGVRIWDRALTAAEVSRRYELCLKRAQPMTTAWMMPWGMAPAAPAAAIMNQIQFANLGADLFDGTLIQ